MFTINWMYHIIDRNWVNEIFGIKVRTSQAKMENYPLFFNDKQTFISVQDTFRENVNCISAATWKWLFCSTMQIVKIKLCSSFVQILWVQHLNNWISNSCVWIFDFWIAWIFLFQYSNAWKRKSQTSSKERSVAVCNITKFSHPR